MSAPRPVVARALVALMVVLASSLLPIGRVSGQSPSVAAHQSDAALEGRDEAIAFLASLGATPLTDEIGPDATHRWTGRLERVEVELQGDAETVEAATLRASPASMDEAIAVSEVLGPWLLHFAPTGAFEALGSLGDRFLNGAHETFDLGDRTLRVDTTLTGVVVDMALRVEVDPTGSGSGPGPSPGWITTLFGPGDFNDPQGIVLADGAYRLEWEVSSSATAGCDHLVTLVGSDQVHELLATSLPPAEARAGHAEFELTAGVYRFVVTSGCGWKVTLRAT